MNGEKEQKFYTFLKVSALSPLWEPHCPTDAGCGLGSSRSGPQSMQRQGLCHPALLLGSWHLLSQLAGFADPRISLACFTNKSQSGPQKRQAKGFTVC